MIEVQRMMPATPNQRTCLVAAALLLGFSMAPRAWASPSYPAEIQTHLQLSSAPACTLCHTIPSGGIGTAKTKFDMSMTNAGLQAENIASLDSALDALAANNTDSNGDRIPDIQQLKDGSDPNTGESVPTEKYGCGARIATGMVRPSGAMTLAMALLGMVLSSRRRTRQVSR